MNITIVGPIAPPIGGVSMHISRLSDLLLENTENNVVLIDESPIRKANIFNMRSLNVFKYLKIMAKSDIVHIHSSVTLFLFIHLLTCLFMMKPNIVTVHSWRKSSLVSLFFRAFFSRSQRVICVNKNISDTLGLKNSIIQPAFLPPTEKILNKEKLPSDIQKWIDERKQSTLFCSNAYKLEIHNNEDLYGLDLCIELAQKLISDKQNVAFVFVIANPTNTNSLIDDYKAKINEYGLNEHFLLVENTSVSFVALLKNSHISIRATNTDGDALSVRESLYLGIPVIVSDVVARPEGSTLFKNRDITSLYETATELLKNKQTLTELNKQNFDYKDFYFKLYRNR